MRFPVKSKVIKTLAMILCLIAILMTSISFACENTDDEINKVSIPTVLNEQTLVKLWDKVLEITDVQPQTINLNLFRLEADKTSVQSLLFQFYGIDTKGKAKLYQAELYSEHSEGELVSFFWDIDTTISDALPSNNPIRYFEELDKVGFSTISTELGVEDGGFLIMLDFQSGNFGISHEYFDIYDMNDGQLTPLNKIIFYTNLSVGRLMLSKLTNGSSQKSEFWFIAEDVEKATTLEYL